MQQRGEETRESIRNAARRLFAQAGYDATGVAEICAAAGVSKGAFYYHFPSKQAVFLELLHCWLDDLENGLKQIHPSDRPGSQPVPQAILQMTEVFPAIFQDAEGQLPIFLEFWTQASRDPVFWQETIAPYHRFQDFFAALVRQGIEEGSFAPVDPQQAARMIMGLGLGLLMQGLMEPGGADWAIVAQAGVRTLLVGLANSQAPAG